jgi:hypothetical protein
MGDGAEDLCRWGTSWVRLHPGLGIRDPGIRDSGFKVQGSRFNVGSCSRFADVDERHSISRPRAHQSRPERVWS